MQNQPSQEAALLEAQLKRQIAELEARLADLKARLPAHSISPGMIAELDELDDALAEARRQLAALQEAG